ncbi:post-PEP-CTERM-1 domain-containing protein [Massilia consociata]|uniref:Post-PEP-CTERM-1 domain-containing protein n=1 Tax=Massilia consociata TaxID=760117 RepID=A0ABV6FGX7_9BURK
MSSHKLMRYLPVVALPLAALALPACAAQDTPKDAAAQQGMVVVRDAQTGELRAPTATEMRALQPRASATAAPAAAPKMVTGPDGRRSVRLGERHMVYSVVTRGSDGKLTDQCVHGVHAAEQAVKQPAPTKAEEHRHESH